MSFNPTTDFNALWRNIAGVETKVAMPGLDYVIAAMARAGLFVLSVSATAPVANQLTTAWLRAAVPSSSGEGTFFLWDKVTSTYLAATAGLLLQLLEAVAGENGTSWWTSTGGPPLNTVGLNGDFALRTDTPFGIYGPKALGVWPATPVPGTADVLTSTSLDNAFGAARGELITRGVAVWQALPIGAANTLLTSTGLDPAWTTLSALMDTVFGAAQGSILYRDAGLWNDLPPGVANQVLATGGPAANPAWAPRTAEFPSGTVMLFQQTAAPTGWTKQTLVNDYGLRVTSGAVGSTPGTPFSTVFAQTAVGNTTLTVPTIPAHDHPYQSTPPGTTTTGGGGFPAANGQIGSITGSTGGGGPHTHSIQLALSYIDVIIASKN